MLNNVDIPQQAASMGSNHDMYFFGEKVWGASREGFNPLGLNSALGLNVDSVEELTDVLLLDEAGLVDESAERPACSMSGPAMTSSSLTSSDFLMITPGIMSMERTTFSPRKLRISTVLPPFTMLALIGNVRIPDASCTGI